MRSGAPGGQVARSGRVLRAGLQEEVKLKQRLGRESVSCPCIWGMAFLAEGRAEAKAWCVGGPARRLGTPWRG